MAASSRVKALVLLPLIAVVACSSSGGSTPAHHTSDSGAGDAPGPRGDSGPGAPEGGGQDAGGQDAAPDTGATGPVTTHPTNILNNGGFEYGLQCFGDWVWSQTGQNYKGDYKFTLTTSAHSGKYALEISCGGSDCLKAAIESQLIYTPANQAYALSGYIQCPSGGSGLLVVEGAATGEIDHSVTCDGNWDLNQVKFTSGSSPSTFRVSVYDKSRQWLRADDLVLTYGDGSVPAQTVLHGGTRNVSVSGQKVLVDGSPYLALGFYDVPYADLQQVKDLGGNTVVGFGANSNHDCFNTAQGSYLDHAYELGIGVLPDSTFTARLAVPDVFPAIMKRFSHHLANLGWYLDDEPDQTSVSWYTIQPNVLVSEYKAAKTATSLPIMVDFQKADWGTASDIAPYTGGADVWMAEPYGTNFGGITKAVANFNANASRPIWLAQDNVTVADVVPKAYFALTAGVTGILYFDWSAFSGSASELQAAGQAFKELGSLKNVLFAPSVSGVTAPSGVSFLARRYQNQTYVLAVNPTSSTASGAFHVPGLAAGATVTVMFENRTLTASAGGFSDTFSGVARHVYRME